MKKSFTASDAHTAFAYFTVGRDPSELHLKEFDEVVSRLQELALDGKAQLAYLDDERPNKVVAYRFTSDEAFGKHFNELVRLGPALEHGAWRLFADQHQFKEFLA